MTYEISFMTANDVAAQIGYRMADWGEGDRATNAWYSPVDTYRERFAALLVRATGLGFRSIDLWTSHLNPSWATDEHVAIARELIAEHGVCVVSLAGWYGATADEFAATCRLAVALGRPILGGQTSAWRRDRAAVLGLLEEHELRLAFENHPETSSAEMLELIGDAPARVGTTVDTGWYGTQGYDAAKAIEELGSRVLHVHLKDVRAVGRHDTCRYGDGIVPIEGCVKALGRIGYRGGISVEHEPETYDPTDEIVANAAMLRGWLEGVPA